VGKGLTTHADCRKLCCCREKIQNGEKAQKFVDAYESEMLERGMRNTMILVLAATISHSVEKFGDRSRAKIGVKQKECEPKVEGADFDTKGFNEILKLLLHLNLFRIPSLQFCRFFANSLI
jgi:hypothetical protein